MKRQGDKMAKYQRTINEMRLGCEQIWKVFLSELPCIQFYGEKRDKIAQRQIYTHSGAYDIMLRVECLFIVMACSSNAQLFLIFKTVSRISVALLHPKLLMI